MSWLESDYQRALLLRIPGEFKDVRPFRRNTGAIKVDDRFFRASLPGQCDIYCLSTGGRHYEIELKRFGKLSKAQESWRAFCIDWRIPWVCLSVAKDEEPPATIDRWLAQLRDFFGSVGA